MDGFDYRTGQGVRHPIAVWREHMRTVLEARGFRRAEHGETFAHGSDGKIVFEVYSNVALRGDQQ